MTTNLEWLWENDRQAVIDAISCEHDNCTDCAFDKYEPHCGWDGVADWLAEEHVDTGVAVIGDVPESSFVFDIDAFAKDHPKMVVKLDGVEHVADTLDVFSDWVDEYGGKPDCVKASAELLRTEANELLGGYVDEIGNLKASVDRLAEERDAWKERFNKVNREKCDLQSQGEQQRLNNLLNVLNREWHVKPIWWDAQSSYTLHIDSDVLKPIPGFTRDDVFNNAMRERDERIAELQPELDKWNKLADGIELPDYPFCEFQPKDKDREIERLTKERDALAQDLADCEKERERWRGAFGDALDKAHAIQAIMDGLSVVDKDGEVVS